MNPQALNRYSYVLNNPLQYIDPTGYDDAYYDAYHDGQWDGWTADPGDYPDGTFIVDSSDWDLSIVKGGEAQPINQDIAQSMIALYSDAKYGNTDRTFAEFLDTIGFLGSPAQNWGLTQGMVETAIGDRQYTLAGLMAGVIGGGTASLVAGGFALLYEGINLTGATGQYMNNTLHTSAFTLGHVILSMYSVGTTPNWLLRHELGHVLQYNLLGGRAFMVAYIGYSIIPRAMEWLGSRFDRGPDSIDLIHVLNPMEVEGWGLPSWRGSLR